MNRTLNGSSINGAALPTWVVRAVVVAVAAASVNVDQTRYTFGSVNDSANVTVNLYPTETVAGRVTATATANADLEPTLRYAGNVLAYATATGNAAVRRDVPATAAGDAGSMAFALIAKELGEASSSMSATVVLAEAYRTKFGAALRYAYADTTGTGTGNVKRYTLLPSTGIGRAGAYAEASTKKNGESFYRHDGYSPFGEATCTASVPQDRNKIIATLGTFTFADAAGASTAFRIQPARATGLGAIDAQSAVAFEITSAFATTSVAATGTASAVRSVIGSATNTADAFSYGPRARSVKVAKTNGLAEANRISVAVLRKAVAHATNTAGASVPVNILFGAQFRSSVNQLAEANGTGRARQNFAAAVADSAVAMAGQAKADVSIYGSVNDALATALVGRAFALANSEIPAPDDRYMIPSAEDRGMLVSAEERTMMVTA